MDMPHGGYMSNYSLPPPPGSSLEMRPSQDSAMSLKDRKDSLSQASLKIKRSLSTPNVRSQPNVPDHLSMGMPGEKRRNKLGYHRTSVACGHCRRRKIRCIPSPADIQGHTRSKGSSRASTGPKIASASSSPAISSGHPNDLAGHQPYPPLAMPPLQNMAPPAMKSAGPEPFSPDGKMPTSAPATGRPFDFAAQPMANWMSADQSPSSATKPNDLNATWRTYPHESPITPSFSPYTPHAPPSAGWNAPVTSESAPRDEVSWSSYPAPPPRSISFSGDGMGVQGSGQYPTMASRQFDRKPSTVSSEMYPPPIATTVSGVEPTQTGTAIEHNVSLSAGAVPPSNYGNWQPQYHYGKTGDAYGGWGYGENGSNPPGQPEQVHAPEGQQASGGMYYPPR
ncbi:unnamed protein product [Parascedosporium putredinis]|uniref:Zn(2)-C6 fungal-type domain-containing protein n=1 Tax=Parascedosporium putredinis TaxID=1442378 RepID=A0A9P1MDD6_9PEZI|nr:unnamed protein product [Parascedosporium putredinis]CAI7998438.1 unnamed protein product [Parascedosporium putredinis]